METYLEYLQLDIDSILAVLIPALIALLVAYFLGMLIYFVYKKTFRGVVYNESFAVSLAVMTIITTMITLAISSNIALSLGMVGALSIIRYRTAIKDPTDLLHLFWAVGTGIAIGANMNHLAFAGSVIVILLMVTLNRRLSSDEMFILIVHYEGKDISDEIRRVLHGKRYQLKSKIVRKDNIELAIEVQVKNNNTAFVDTLKELPSVQDVAVIQYTGEYHG